MIDQAQLSLEGLEGAKLVRLTGREAMNELTAFVVDVLSDDAHLDPGRLVAQSAIVSVADAMGEGCRLALLTAGSRKR